MDGLAGFFMVINAAEENNQWNRVVWRRTTVLCFWSLATLALDALNNNVILFVYNIMGNIITNTSTQIFGLDKILKEKKDKKRIYPIPVRGRGLYGFVRLMNDYKRVWYITYTESLHIHIVPATIIYGFFYQFINNRRGHLHRKFHLNRHLTFKDIGIRAHEAIQVQFSINDF